MKRISSILFACVLAVLAMVGTANAQTYTGAPNPAFWDNPATWGIPGYTPGGAPNDNNVVTINSLAVAVTLNNSAAANRVRYLQIQNTVGGNVTLNGNGTLRLGVLEIQQAITLNITGSLNVIIDSLLTGSQAASINIGPGCTLTVNATAPNSLNLGPVIAAASSAVSNVVVGPGANGGSFPAQLFPGAPAGLTYTGSVQINGGTNMTFNFARPATAGPLVLNGGTVNVLAGATLTLAQTASGSLSGSGQIQGGAGGTVVLRGTAASPFNFGVLPTANFANPFIGTLQIGDATASGNVLTTSGGNMTIGIANPTSTAQQGLVSLFSSVLQAGAGSTLTLNGTLPTAIQQLNAAGGNGFVTATTGGVLALGPGFATGLIPSGGIASVGGQLRTLGPLTLTLAGNTSLLVTSGSMSLGGDLQLAGTGQLWFSNTGPNTLISNPGRIAALSPSQVIRFMQSANGGVIPGKFFQNPFQGSWFAGTSIQLQDSLNFDQSAGTFTFSGSGTVVTINANSFIGFNQTATNRILNLPGFDPNGVNGAAQAGTVNALTIARDSYFQGVGSTSILQLGLGFNGGTTPAYGNGLINVAFLPVPVFPTTTTGSFQSGFNGRLVLTATQNFNRDLQIGPNGALELRGGNYIVLNGRYLQLFNQSPNSVFGSGFIQGAAPGAAVAPYYPFPHVYAAPAAGLGSSVMIGPGFNGGILPAANFANPFTGILDVSTAGTTTVQGDLVVGIPTQRSFFVIGASRVGFNDATGDNPSAAVTGALNGIGLAQNPTLGCLVTIGANSSVTLNGTDIASLWGSPRISGPGPNLAGTFQGSGSTSRLIIGQGHGAVPSQTLAAQTLAATNAFELPALAGVAYAFTTNGNFISSPFNGQLVFNGPSFLATSATIGVNGGVTMNAPVALATSSTYMNTGWRTELNFPAAPHSAYSGGLGLVLQINGQGSNALTGVSTIQANTSNTIVLGSGFSNNSIDGSKFADPYRGTLATVSALTLTNTLNIGALKNPRQDGHVPAGTAFGVGVQRSSAFLNLGADLTVGSGGFLGVTNAYANPFTGIGKVLALSGGQVTIGDFTNGAGGSVGGAGSYFQDRAALAFPDIYAPIFAEGATAVPTVANKYAANIDASNFASPFNGRLVIGTTGRSNFNLTNGTLTLGASGALTLVSPLRLATIGTVGAVPPRDGYPNLVLNNTGAGSVTLTTTGSVLNSSIGTVSQNVSERVGGTITLGPGFNGGTLPGNLFARPFSGRLSIPSGTNLTLTGDLTFSTAASRTADIDGARGLNDNRIADFGVLNLGGNLTVADGVALTLGTTGSITAFGSTAWATNPGAALQGSGVISGATPNSRVILSGTFNDQAVTGANFSNPFNGRLIISTGSTFGLGAGNPTFTLVGNLTLGAPGSSNGILDIPLATGIFSVSGGDATTERGILTINNTSGPAAVFPGAGLIAGATNQAYIVIGQNAVGNTVPTSKFVANPGFVGTLVTGTGTVPLNLASTFVLSNGTETQTSINGTTLPVGPTGRLQLNSPLLVNSGARLDVQNTNDSAFTGSGVIQAVDQTSQVRFFALTRTVGANRNVIPGNNFSNPWVGTILAGTNFSAGAPVTSANVILTGRLVLGAAGSSNGFLNTSGASMQLNAISYVAPGAPYNVTTTANLVINNVQPVESVLPGGGRIEVLGNANGLVDPITATVGNGRGTVSIFALGPNALAGIFPTHKIVTTATIGRVYGIVMTSTGTYTATSGTSVAFTTQSDPTQTGAAGNRVGGGALFIGGPKFAASGVSIANSTTAEIVIPSGVTFQFNTPQAGALGGIGALRPAATSSTVAIGNATLNVNSLAGQLDGARFSQGFNGTVVINNSSNLLNVTQLGTLRIGDGTGSAGRLQINHAAAGQTTYIIGTNATLDLRTLNSGIVFNNAVVGTPYVDGQDSTSKLILGPGYNGGLLSSVNIATPTVARSLFQGFMNGVLVTSTGTLTYNEGLGLTIGTSLPDSPTYSFVSPPRGGLELGGPLVIPVANTVTLVSTYATALRNSNSTGQLVLNPTAAAGVPAEFVFAGTNPPTAGNAIFSANNGVVPVNIFGSGLSPTATAVVGVRGAVANNSRLSFNAGNYTLSGGGLTVTGDLNFGANGGLLNIPASTTLNVNSGFVTANVNNQGAVQGANATSVLSFGPLAASTHPVGPLVLSINSPSLGTGTGFNGTLRFLRDGQIDPTGTTAFAVTIATVGVLDIPSTTNTLTLQGLTIPATLNLNNTAPNSFLPNPSGSGLVVPTIGINRIQGNGATTTLSFGPNFNGGSGTGLIPGSQISSTTTPLNANVVIRGTQTLTSPLTVSANVAVDFTANSSNKFILGNNNLTALGTLRNTNTTQYFVTNGIGLLGLGNVGNATFPVGPSAAVFAPININNNGSPATFSLRALGAVSQAAPFATGSAVLRQPIVNQQWNVTQNTNVTPGFSVTVTPLWLAGQETGGFNRNLAVTNAFTTTSGTISSGAGAAANDPNFTGYFRAGVTVTQIATNNLNNTPILVSSQPIPVVLAFTPPAQSSGATLTITGNRFAPGATVSLGGVLVPAANVTLVPGGVSGIDTLRVVVPPTAASGNVVVTQAGGSSTATGFTFLGAPLRPAQIFTVTPSPIPAGLGDVEVTITGAAFGVLTPRVVAVGSGITSTITPSASSTTRIVVTVPGNVVRNIGSVVFTVTSLDRLPVSTTVTVSTPPALVLTSLAPASTSGNLRAFTLRVNGNNFSGQSIFSLGSTSLRVMGVIRNSDGTLTALVEVPVGAVSGNLNVLNLNGQSASLPFVINSLPRPVITNVSPNILPPGSPNTIITVNGRNLIPGVTVSFNGQQLTGVQLTGDSLLTFTIPAALLVTPDLGVLTITNPDGQSIGYRLPVTVGAPGAVNLTAVSPSTTIATGSAFTATLTGTGFAGNVRVFLGGQALTVVSTSDTQIRVIVPGNQLTGTFPVQVANPSMVVSNSLSMTINPNIDPAIAVSISSVSPDQILERTGTSNFVINGVNFAQGATVRLGSVQFGSVQLVVSSITANRIIATLPNTFTTGLYTLSVTNPNGSVGFQDYFIGTIGVAQDPLAGIRVYPNPVVEAVSVEANLERAAKVVITVTNSLGQRVMVVEQNAAAGFFSRSLNINSLPSGAYMVEITDGARRSVEKIIKN